MIHSNNNNSYHLYTYNDYLSATSTFPSELKQESNSSSWISDIRSLQQDDDFSLCDDHQQTLLQDKELAAKPNNKDEGDKKRRQRKNKKGVDDQADDTKKAITAGGSSKAGEGCVVYVRAKRGQATDSHSLAERVRRQLISDKMKPLQSLVPGCDKMVGKRLILDEIINYIHSLQTHVQFLKTRLALIDDPMFISLSNHALDSLTIHQQDPAYASLQCSTMPSECSSLHEIRYASVAPSSTALTSASLTLLQEYGHYNSMLS